MVLPERYRNLDTTLFEDYPIFKEMYDADKSLFLFSHSTPTQYVGTFRIPITTFLSFFLISIAFRAQ